MQKTLARCLLTALLATSCRSHDAAQPNVDLVATENTTVEADELPMASTRQPAMALEEGAAGKSGSVQGLTDTSNISSGFDGSNVYGGLYGADNRNAGVIG